MASRPSNGTPSASPSPSGENAAEPVSLADGSEYYRGRTAQVSRVAWWNGRTSFLNALSVPGVARLLFGRITSADHRRRRLLGIIQGVVTSLGNRVIGVLVSFLSVPLTIGYLGAERYGAWVALGSLLAWLQLTDFGLGNGLTNAIATAAGRDRPDLVRMNVSNAFALLLGIGAVVALVAGFAWPHIDWSSLFGLTTTAARDEIGTAAALALGIFILQFPLAVTGRIYIAYQEGRIGNYWATAGNVLSLAALLAVTHTKGGLPALVAAVSGTWLAVNAVSTAWLFLHHRPSLRPSLRLVDFSQMRALGNVGGRFFLIQILALIVFQTDNLVIAHYLGAAHVPQYSLTYTLFGYASLPQSLLFSYLWAAYTEAIARHDIAWVQRTFYLNLWIGLGFTALGVAFLAAIAQPFIGWWAGEAATPTVPLVAWMTAWSMINAFTSPIACLLAAAAHLKRQIIYSAAGTALNIVLTLTLVQSWGVEGVIAATVVSYAVLICGPCYLDGVLLIRKLKLASPAPLVGGRP